MGPRASWVAGWRCIDDKQATERIDDIIWDGLAYMEDAFFGYTGTILTQDHDADTRLYHLIRNRVIKHAKGEAIENGLIPDPNDDVVQVYVDQEPRQEGTNYSGACRQAEETQTGTTTSSGA